jgi:carbamoyltransferase
LGPSFSNREIKNELNRLNANFKKVEDVCVETALLINAQKVVGWFQGEMEFGPRALGNRSILGDARNPEMQKRINLKIKFREGFRPFAPSVIRELVSEYFEFEGESPYMLFVYNLKSHLSVDKGSTTVMDRLSSKTCDYPAITHIDNSSRIQTVSELDNPKYYSLLKAFNEVSGCGMLVNTSFNVRGEPIVCSPYDAYRCFMETNMDVLAIGDYLLVKEDQPTWDRGKNKFKLD